MATKPEEIRDKVFCAECVHLERGGLRYRCCAKYKIHYSPINWKLEASGDPFELNANNDCPHFKPKEPTEVSDEDLQTTNNRCKS